MNWYDATKCPTCARPWDGCRCDTVEDALAAIRRFGIDRFDPMAGQQRQARPERPTMPDTTPRQAALPGFQP
jgi:hypothetical protein